MRDGGCHTPARGGTHVERTGAGACLDRRRNRSQPGDPAILQNEKGMSWTPFAIAPGGRHQRLKYRVFRAP